ncbi:hypothetical protein [Halalkalibacillus halophilus]|uniref:hypothetical protein n=1 Tax=Halalkalibacillus halophilus TaxID=392827 RepID=UPI0004018931|nr:hypothetical protein [Halalkalibacillus halophilus]
MNFFEHYLLQEERDIVEELEAAFQEATTVEEAETLHSRYEKMMMRARNRYYDLTYGETTPSMIEEVLTTVEHAQIKELQRGMDRAWTNKGVDKYYTQIMEIIDHAKSRYQQEVSI